MAEDELREEIDHLRDRLEQQDEEIQRLKQERKRKHVDRSESQEQNTQSDGSMNRRRFLKSLAGGAAGLGALGLMGNASGFDVTSSHPFTIRNATNQKNFEVDTQGVLTTNQVGTSSNQISNIHVDTVNAERVSSADFGVTRNAREYMLQNDYNTIAPAINALIEELFDEQPGGGRIVIPPPRNGDPGAKWDMVWEVNEPITVPYQFARAKRLALTGVGTAGTTLHTAPGFSGTPDYVIQKEPAGQSVTGSDVDAGFTLLGLTIVDTENAVSKLVDINDTLRPTIKDCKFVGGAATDVGVHLHGPDAGAFHSIIENCRVVKRDGTTGLRLGSASEDFGSGANASQIRHCQFTGAVGTSIGVDLPFAGSVAVVGGNTDNAGTAFRIGSNGVAIFGHRFEAPYGEEHSDPNIVTPVEIQDGVEGTYVNPNVRHGINAAAEDFISASKWSGQYNTFDMGAVKRYGVDHGGGFDHHWLYDPTLGNTNAERGPGFIRLETAASSGDSVRTYAPNLGHDGAAGLGRLDIRAYLMDSTQLYTSLGWWDDASNYAMFIADPTDSLGTGITTNWIARTYIGGSEYASSPTDTGVRFDLGGNQNLAIIPEKPDTPRRWRYVIDGTTVAVHEASSGSATLGSTGPRIHLETKEAAVKTLRIASLVPRITNFRGKKL